MINYSDNVYLMLKHDHNDVFVSLDVKSSENGILGPDSM